ncbi:hypothetical protein L0244_16320 [bacterium]|nr:hypothetical protein [bacterium]
MTLKVGSQSSSSAPTGVQEEVGHNDAQQIPHNDHATTSVSDQSKQTGPNAKKSEMDLTTQARYATITKQLPKTPITGPEVRKQVIDPRQMADSNIYTPREKAAYYQRYLEREGSAGLKKLLSESENWPESSRHALDDALAKTPSAAAYATRMSSTDDQIKFLDRMFALGYNDNASAKAFVDFASPATLSNIASRFHDFSHLGERVNKDNLGSGMYFMKRLAERAGELSPDAQKMFAKSAVDFNIFEKSDLRGNEAFRRQVLQTMFAKMSPDAKNSVFDELQNTDKALGFARSLGGEFSVPQEVLKGLTDKNADFLRQMYAKLMNDAKLTGDTKMFSLYERNLKHLEGWMENHFPNYVRK